MRTSLTIDDDVLAAARSLARSENRSLGEVISHLARRALAPRPQTASRAGFPVFEVPPGASLITAEMVRKAAEEVGS